MVGVGVCWGLEEGLGLVCWGFGSSWVELGLGLLCLGLGWLGFFGGFGLLMFGGFEAWSFPSFRELWVLVWVFGLIWLVCLGFSVESATWGE